MGNRIADQAIHRGRGANRIEAVAPLHGVRIQVPRRRRSRAGRGERQPRAELGREQPRRHAVLSHADHDVRPRGGLRRTHDARQVRAAERRHRQLGDVAPAARQCAQQRGQVPRRTGRVVQGAHDARSAARQRNGSRRQIGFEIEIAERGVRGGRQQTTADRLGRHPVPAVAGSANGAHRRQRALARETRDTAPLGVVQQVGAQLHQVDQMAMGAHLVETAAEGRLGKGETQQRARRPSEPVVGAQRQRAPSYRVPPRALSAAECRVASQDRSGRDSE